MAVELIGLNSQVVDEAAIAQGLDRVAFLFRSQGYRD